MEMTILAIISPTLQCEWNISSMEQAMITTIVFSGMMLSSTFWGNICDRFGRKMVSFLSSFFFFLQIFPFLFFFLIFNLFIYNFIIFETISLKIYQRNFFFLRNLKNIFIQ